MRDKCIIILTVDADLLSDQSDISNDFVYRDWALEVRDIDWKLAHKSHQALNLFWSDCESALVKYSDVSILKTEICIIHIVTHLYRSQADTHEEHIVFLVLRVELDHNDVHDRLEGRIQSTCLNLKIVDQVEINMIAENDDDLLDLALHDKRKKEIEEINVVDDIDLK